MKEIIGVSEFLQEFRSQKKEIDQLKQDNDKLQIALWGKIFKDTDEKAT